MEDIKVSVVIPICSKEVQFRDSLDSLRNQTLKAAEFIILKDAQADDEFDSMDDDSDSMDIEREYKEMDSRFIFTNEAFATDIPKNLAMKQAKGKYILFLAENSTLDHEALEKAYNQAERQNAQLVWFKSKRKNINTGESATLDYAFRKHQLPKKEVFAFSEIKGNPFTAFNGWLWDKMFNIEYISNLDLEFHDPKIIKDDYFTTIAMINACKIAVIEEALVTQNRCYKDEIFQSLEEDNASQGSENESNIPEEETSIPLDLEGEASVSQSSENENNIPEEEANIPLYLESEASVSQDIENESNIPEEEANIPLELEDEAYECEYNTLFAIVKELEKDVAKKEMLLQYRIVTINHLIWLLGNGFNSRKATISFCKLLSKRGLEELGIFEVKLDTLSYYEEQNLLILRQLKEYGSKIGPFEKEVFIKLAQTKLSGSTTVVGSIQLNNVPTKGAEELLQEEKDNKIPNVVYKERSGRYIFRQDETIGKNGVMPLFSITLQHTPRNNVSLSVDFIYMARYAPLVKNTLNLSLSLKENSTGQLDSVVHQAEWEKNEEVFLKNIYYIFKKNVLTIFAKYTEIYSGFEYKINMISTRSKIEKFTFSEESDQVGGTKPLSPLVEAHIPIKTVSKESGLNIELYYGAKTIFKTSATDAEGVDLLAIELAEVAWNGISCAVDITYLKKQGIAIYDTLYCSFRIIEDDGKLEARITQAEWKNGYKLLKDNIYYRIENNILYIGGRYTGIWNGYVYKVTHVVCRRKSEDYFIASLAGESATTLRTVTEDIFIEDKADWNV